VLTLDDRVCAVGDLPSATVNDEMMVLDIANGVYLNLNAMGSDILRRLEQEGTLRDLCLALARECEAPADQVEREVLSFATRLRDAGLIRLVA